MCQKLKTETDSTSSELLVWDIESPGSGSTVWSHHNDGSSISAIKLDREGQRLAFVTSETNKTAPNCLKIHSFMSQQTFELEPFSGSANVQAIEFSNDGAWLAVCDMSGTLNIYNTEQGSEDFGKRTFMTAKGPNKIYDLAWNPADTRIAGVNRESVTLWDAIGNPVMELKGAPRWADLIYRPQVCFSHDGRKIAASQWSNHVRIWSVAEEPERLLNRDATVSAPGPAGQSEKVLRAVENITADSAEHPWAIALRGQLRSREQKGKLALADYLNCKKTLSDGDPCIMFHGYASVLAPSIPFHEYDGFTIESWVRGGWHPSRFPPVIASQLPPTISDRLTGMSVNEQRKLKSLVSMVDCTHFKAPGWAWENDNWTHFAVCHSAEGQRYFVNGKEVSLHSQNPKTPIDAEAPWKRFGQNEPFRIGRTVFGEDLPDLRCLMRSIRVSSMPLYTDSFTPEHEFSTNETTALLFDFSKDDTESGTLVVDRSNNGRDGRLVDAWWHN